MASTGNLPFQKITSTGWQNLVMTGISAFYLIQVGFDLFWRNTCGHLAIDFCAFWSAGRVANVNGYPAIYNLDLLRQVQLNLFPKLLNLSNFKVSPIAYLPVFILPFQWLAHFDLLSGFFIWTIINLIILVVYLRFLYQKIIDRPLPIRLLSLFIICLPVYWNLFNGQVNVWLLICVGEFIRAILSGKPFKAGIWLGGLWLKPQLLILIVLALLFQKAGKILTGFITSSVAILGGSWLMIGLSGFQHLIDLWLGFSNGLPTNDVEIMMNWRMVGLHLSFLTSPTIGWIVIGVGLIATLLATIYIWDRHIEPASGSFVVACLGLLAAANLFAWHSHIHMAMVLIPPLIYLKGQNLLPDKLLNYWVYLPAGIYIGVFIIASLITTSILPASLNGALNFLRGASEFGLNIYLLIWTMLYSRNKKI